MRAGWTLVLGLLSLALPACQSTSVTAVRFHPTNGSEDRSVIEGQLLRSCEPGACRTQLVRLNMPDGTSMEGSLTFLPSASLSTVDVDIAPNDILGPVPVGVGARIATMQLGGGGWKEMTCRVVFANGTRHGRGTCKTLTGATLRIQF